MVAIVTGNGLGLERSSAKTLGSRGLLGSAFLGRNNEAVTVNAATGNLVIQNTDEVLIGRGPDATFNRTYNSLGAYSNLAGAADPDSWLVSTQRKMKLTGTANVAGSTATLVDWDGSIVTFTYDVANGDYRTNDPAYRNQRATLSGSTFTFTDVTTRIVQTFDSAIGGRIVNAADADGNIVTYTYDAATTAGKLTRVTTANSTGTQFNYTDLAYTGTNLTTGVQVRRQSDRRYCGRDGCRSGQADQDYGRGSWRREEADCCFPKARHRHCRVREVRQGRGRSYSPDSCRLGQSRLRERKGRDRRRIVRPQLPDPHAADE